MKKVLGIASVLFAALASTSSFTFATGTGGSGLRVVTADCMSMDGSYHVIVEKITEGREGTVTTHYRASVNQGSDDEMNFAVMHVPSYQIADQLFAGAYRSDEGDFELMGPGEARLQAHLKIQSLNIDLEMNCSTF